MIRIYIHIYTYTYMYLYIYICIYIYIHICANLTALLTHPCLRARLQNSPPSPSSTAHSTQPQARPTPVACAGIAAHTNTHTHTHTSIHPPLSVSSRLVAMIGGTHYLTLEGTDLKCLYTALEAPAKQHAKTLSTAAQPRPVKKSWLCIKKIVRLAFDPTLSTLHL